MVERGGTDADWGRWPKGLRRQLVRSSVALAFSLPKWTLQHEAAEAEVDEDEDEDEDVGTRTRNTARPLIPRIQRRFRA